MRGMNGEGGDSRVLMKGEEGKWVSSRYGNSLAGPRSLKWIFSSPHPPSTPNVPGGWRLFAFFLLITKPNIHREKQNSIFHNSRCSHFPSFAFAENDLAHCNIFPSPSSISFFLCIPHPPLKIYIKRGWNWRWKKRKKWKWSLNEKSCMSFEELRRCRPKWKLRIAKKFFWGLPEGWRNRVGKMATECNSMTGLNLN